MKRLVKIVVVAEKDGSLKRGDEIVATPLAQPSVGAEVLLESEQKRKFDSETAKPDSDGDLKKTKSVSEKETSK